jgi:hypothetical protein
MLAIDPTTLQSHCVSAIADQTREFVNYLPATSMALPLFHIFLSLALS